MKPSPPAYLSYMLRLWRTDSHWHASLTDPLTGQKTGFANLERMVAFLRRQMEPDRDNSQADPGMMQCPDVVSDG